MSAPLAGAQDELEKQQHSGRYHARASTLMVVLLEWFNQGDKASIALVMFTTPSCFEPGSMAVEGNEWGGVRRSSRLGPRVSRLLMMNKAGSHRFIYMVLLAFPK